MIIYELVVDNDETWYSLGLFDTAEAAIAIATARDGVDGVSVSESGDDGETLFVRRRVVGHFDCCGDTGEDVARIIRNPTYQESTDSYPVWVSEIVSMPNAQTTGPAGSDPQTTKDDVAGSGASPCSTDI